MPIPTTDDTALRAAERIPRLAKLIRQACVSRIAECDSGTVDLYGMLNQFAFNTLAAVLAEWQTCVAVAGVPGLLRQMFPGTWASDAACTTDLTAATTALTSTLSYITTNTPKDGSGYVLIAQINAQGTGFTMRTTSSPAAINPLRTQLIACRDAFTA